jgi:hypothetical protein
MSTALLDAPRSLFATPPGSRAEGGRRTTLEQLLEGRWQTARAEGTTECPICACEMRIEAEQARCSGCGTTLA